MAQIRLFTKHGCPYCDQAQQWLREHGCSFDSLEITKDVHALREWRALSGGVGVPVLAHGRDIVIGFSPERYAQLLECCRRTTPARDEELRAPIQQARRSGT